MIPYGKQFIDDDDIDSVIEVLRSDWLTTGPTVDKFERSLADYAGTKYAVAVNSGTAALHCAMYAICIGPGDEVIVPAMTFAATANCVIFQGGTPVFADVISETLLIDPVKIEEKITKRTKAIIAVDYAGQPCDYDKLRSIAEKYDLKLVADGCHALGAEYRGKRVGTLADMTVFSFHPVKHITTGEGGAIVTDDENLSNRMRLFRNHGCNNDFKKREQDDSWYYEMIDLGYNYRITDIQCALGLSQLKKLPDFIDRRRTIARAYDQAFSGIPEIDPLQTSDYTFHTYHLYVVRINFDALNRDRSWLFKKLRREKIGVNVHYIPVHLHPYYRERFGMESGMCPVAESAYEQIISLPMYPAMTDDDIEEVISVLLSNVAELKV